MKTINKKSHWKELEEDENYDHKLMDSLIGKTIYYHLNDWIVLDHVYNHLFLIRDEDGYNEMTKCIYIESELKQQEKAKSLRETNAFQKLFDERGCYIVDTGSGYDICVGGKIGSFVRKDEGVTIDRRHIFLDNDIDIDGIFKFGSEPRGFSMAHTFEKDDTKPCGYKMIDGRDEILIDKLKWMSHESASQKVLKYFHEELKKATGFKDEDKIHISYNKIEDCDTTFTFFKKNDKKGFRYRGQYKTDWGGPIHYIDIGETKKTYFKSGRGSDWGYKWSIPKKTEIMLWKEIKEQLTKYFMSTVDEALKLTTEEKIKQG